MQSKLSFPVNMMKTISKSVNESVNLGDLTKTFNTVIRNRLWKIMAKFGCPPRFIAMVRQFRDGMKARVQND